MLGRLRPTRGPSLSHPQEGFLGSGWGHVCCPPTPTCHPLLPLCAVPSPSGPSWCRLTSLLLADDWAGTWCPPSPRWVVGETEGLPTASRRPGLQTSVCCLFRGLATSPPAPSQRGMAGAVVHGSPRSLEAA